MILGETFDHATFRRSLGRVFAAAPDGQLDCGFNATLEVFAPKASTSFCQSRHNRDP